MIIDPLWHLRGSRSLERAPDNEAVIASVRLLLERQRKPVIKTSAEGLSFNDPLWLITFGPNWRTMLIYDRGRFWIDNGPRGRRLHYDLRSLHGFVFCLGAAAMFVFITLANQGGLRSALGIGALAFGWLYGMNLLIAIPRVWLAILFAVRRARAR